MPRITDRPAITAPAARIFFQSIFIPRGWVTARTTRAITGSAVSFVAEVPLAAMHFSVRGGWAGCHHPPRGDRAAVPWRPLPFVAPIGAVAAAFPSQEWLPGWP